METKNLTIEEAAAKLGVPVGTLRHWRLNEQGPKAFKLGRRLLYAESDLEQFIAEARGEAS